MGDANALALSCGALAITATGRRRVRLPCRPGPVAHHDTPPGRRDHAVLPVAEPDRGHLVLVGLDGEVLVGRAAETQPRGDPVLILERRQLLRRQSAAAGDQRLAHPPRPRRDFGLDIDHYR